MIQWLEQKARWSNLRIYGISPLVRATVFMPVFGYLILLNEHIDSWLIITAPWLPEQFRYEPTNSIMSLFYGTLFLGIASGIFTVGCPLRIKKYDSAVEFVASESKYFYAGTHQVHLIQMLEEASRELRPWQRRLPEFHDLGTTLAYIGAEANIDLGSANVRSLKEHWGHPTVVMTQFWHTMDTSRRFLRILILILFAFGTIGVAVPTVLVVTRVTVATFKNWFG